jgi:hypothetical protein
MERIAVPGEVLRTPVALGLTFMELATLASVPLILMLPGLMLEQIPLLWTGGIGLVTGFGMLVLVVRTPEGQKPTGWAPAYISRKFNPDSYTNKPRQQGREEPVHQDRILTVAELVAEHDPAADASADEIDIDDHLLVQHASRPALSGNDDDRSAVEDSDERAALPSGRGSAEAGPAVDSASAASDDDPATDAAPD